MRNKVLVGLIALVLCYHKGISQNFKSNESYPGFAVTHSDTIYGLVSINQDDNQVLIKKDNSFINLSVRQLKKVVIERNGEKEAFYSGPFGLKSEPFLFKALVDGPLPLLFREGLKFSSYDEEILPPHFVKSNRQIYSLGDKKEIMLLFSDHKTSMQNFVKNEKIKFKEETDLVRIFAYYNSLQAKEESINTDG